MSKICQKRWNSKDIPILQKNFHGTCITPLLLKSCRWQLLYLKAMVPALHYLLLARITGETASGRHSSLDNEVVTPLYEVATLCRDPIIRRKAMDLLRSGPRQEGVFDSYLCAMTAEQIIEIEEAAALDSLPAYSYDWICSSVLSRRNYQRHNVTRRIEHIYEIPESLRLTYAHPKIDVIQTKVLLTLGQTSRMNVDIPWLEMKFLVDG